MLAMCEGPELWVEQKRENDLQSVETRRSLNLKSFFFETSDLKKIQLPFLPESWFRGKWLYLQD